MTEAQDNKDALLVFVSGAHDEIADAVVNQQAGGAAETRQLCRDHIENIGWAAEMAGLPYLKAVADGLVEFLSSENPGMDSEQISELVVWLGDVLLHIESPDDADTFSLLLNPLPEALQTKVLESIAGEAVFDDADSENAFPEEDESVSSEDVDNCHVEMLEDSNMSSEDWGEDDAEPGDDSMLGMLASELKDVTPQLSELALVICSTEDTNELPQAIDAYQELVSRVGTVSEELGLTGLFLVCAFIKKNTSKMAEMPLTDRLESLEILLGWPAVIVDHLAQPANDALCIAVVDYLEEGSWPEPLPYREVRELIDGLAKKLELSAEFEVTGREVVANPEDVSLTISEDASPELIDAFFAESPGHAETFSKLVEDIANGKEIQKNVAAAQRIAHTLKGSGNIIGVRGIANLSHHLEDIFEYIGKHHIKPPRALANSMQEAADTIEVMLEYLQGMAPAPVNAQRVLQDVLDWANRIDSGSIRSNDFSEEENDAQDEQDVEDKVREKATPTDFVEKRGISATTLTRTDSVRVPLDVLDNIFRIVSESAITIGQIQERLNRLEEGNKQVRKNNTSLQHQQYELENLVSIRGLAARHRTTAVAASGTGGFDPLEMDEYDEFYGAAHSYIEGVTDSREILLEVNTEVSELGSLFLQQQRLNKELQQVVMTTRMVPVSNISARLQRAVRQVCRATGKQAELTIIGEDLLLDGDVLSKLADPLMHMLRNAIDHSIEGSGDRFDQGKSDTGRVTLSFSQQGNNVVVSCADDGRGLDYEKIKETAIARGLLAAQEKIDNPALTRMILHPGFSTREQVTQVSGRGVGMDVVHNAIQSLNGTMDIGDNPGGGTRMLLSLPITLLTSHCLLVGVGKDLVYAIPTVSLTQILASGTGKMGDVGGNVTYQLGKDVYRACSLNSLLGIPDENTDIANATVLLVQSSQGIMAITVERVVSSYDLVVKNMGAYVKSVRGVTGVSILGNGEVVAVLDLSTLFQTRDASGAVSRISNVQTQAELKISLPQVLIVDDSLSVRNSLSQLMSDGGYRVATARDGLEAINVLEEETPDIVLTDLEMPRMNGLDLVSFIRNSSKFTSIPIIMITSRTTAKHQQQAELAGVNRYITKPFTEDDVLASIGEQLAPIS